MQSRRDFLQKFTAASIAVPLTQLYNQAAGKSISAPYDGPILRVAIMGLGSYGTRVADAMQACTKAKLVGVISGTPAKIKNWQAKYSIPEQRCRQ